MSSISPFQDFITSHSNIFLPIFRSACCLLGITMTATGIFAIFNPVLLATNFGIPIRGNNESVNGLKTKPRSSSFSPSRQFEAGVGWMTAFAGRETALGVSVLALLWMNEMKALSTVVTLSAALVAGGDAAATFWHGRKGAYKHHLIPGIAFFLVAPLGFFLA